MPAPLGPTRAVSEPGATVQPVGRDHAQRAVLGVDERDRGLDDAPENVLEVELLDDRAVRVKQVPEPPLCREHALRARDELVDRALEIGSRRVREL